MLHEGTTVPNHKNIAAYRPVTCLEPLHKVMTAHIAAKVLRVLHDFKRISPEQHGYVIGGSCEAPTSVMYMVWEHAVAFKIPHKSTAFDQSGAFDSFQSDNEDSSYEMVGASADVIAVLKDVEDQHTRHIQTANRVPSRLDLDVTDEPGAEMTSDETALSDSATATLGGGAPQGCSFSSPLWIIIADGSISYAKGFSSCKGYRVTTGQWNEELCKWEQTSAEESGADGTSAWIQMVCFVDDNTLPQEGNEIVNDAADHLLAYLTFCGTMSKESKGKTVGTGTDVSSTKSCAINDVGEYKLMHSTVVSPAGPAEDQIDETTRGNISFLGSPFGHNAEIGAHCKALGAIRSFRHRVREMRPSVEHLTMLANGATAQRILATCVAAFPASEHMMAWSVAHARSLLENIGLNPTMMDVSTCAALSLPTTLIGGGMPDYRTLTTTRAAVNMQSALSSDDPLLRLTVCGPAGSRVTTNDAPDPDDPTRLLDSWDRCHDRKCLAMHQIGLSFHRCTTLPFVPDKIDDGIDFQYLHDWATCLMVDHNSMFRAIRDDEVNAGRCVPKSSARVANLDAIIRHGTHTGISHGVHLSDSCLHAAYFATQDPGRVAPIIHVKADVLKMSPHHTRTCRLCTVPEQLELQGDDCLSPLGSRLAAQAREIFVEGDIILDQEYMARTIILPDSTRGISRGMTIAQFVENPNPTIVAELAKAVQSHVMSTSTTDVYSDGSHAHGRDNLMAMHVDRVGVMTDTTPSAIALDIPTSTWYQALLPETPEKHIGPEHITLLWLHFSPSVEEDGLKCTTRSADLGWFLIGAIGSASDTTVLTALTKRRGKWIDTRLDQWNDVSATPDPVPIKPLWMMNKSSKRYKINLTERIWLPALNYKLAVDYSGKGDEIGITNVNGSDVITPAPRWLHLGTFIHRNLRHAHRLRHVMGVDAWDDNIAPTGLGPVFSSHIWSTAADVDSANVDLHVAHTPETIRRQALRRRSSAEASQQRARSAETSRFMTAGTFRAAEAMFQLTLNELTTSFHGETQQLAVVCPCAVHHEANHGATACQLKHVGVNFRKQWAATFENTMNAPLHTINGLSLTRFEADSQIEFHCACGMTFSSTESREIHVANAKVGTFHCTPPSECDQISGGWVVHHGTDVHVGTRRYSLAIGTSADSMQAEGLAGTDGMDHHNALMDAAKTIAGRWICDCLSLLTTVDDTDPAKNTPRRQTRRNHNKVILDARDAKRSATQQNNTMESTWVPCEHDVNSTARVLAFCKEHKGNRCCDDLAKWIVRQTWPSDPRYYHGVGQQSEQHATPIYASLNGRVITGDLAKEVTQCLQLRQLNVAARAKAAGCTARMILKDVVDVKITALARRHLPPALQAVVMRTMLRRMQHQIHELTVNTEPRTSKQLLRLAKLSNEEHRACATCPGSPKNDHVHQHRQCQLNTVEYIQRDQCLDDVLSGVGPSMWFDPIVVEMLVPPTWSELGASTTLDKDQGADSLFHFPSTSLVSPRQVTHVVPDHWARTVCSMFKRFEGTLDQEQATAMVTLARDRTVATTGRTQFMHLHPTLSQWFQCNWRLNREVIDANITTPGVFPLPALCAKFPEYESISAMWHGEWFNPRDDRAHWGEHTFIAAIDDGSDALLRTVAQAVNTAKRGYRVIIGLTDVGGSKAVGLLRRHGFKHCLCLPPSCIPFDSRVPFIDTQTRRHKADNIASGPDRGENEQDNVNRGPETFPRSSWVVVSDGHVQGPDEPALVHRNRIRSSSVGPAVRFYVLERDELHMSPCDMQDLAYRLRGCLCRLTPTALPVWHQHGISTHLSVPRLGLHLTKHHHLLALRNLQWQPGPALALVSATFADHRLAALPGLIRELHEHSRMLDVTTNLQRDYFTDGVLPRALTKAVHLLTGNAAERDRVCSKIVRSQLRSALHLDTVLCDRQHRHLDWLGIHVGMIGNHTYERPNPSSHYCGNRDCGAATTKYCRVKSRHSKHAAKLVLNNIKSWTSHYHRRCDANQLFNCGEWVRTYLSTHGIDVCMVCAYPTLLDMHNRNVETPASRINLSQLVQLHRRAVIDQNKVQLPIPALNAAVCLPPNGGVIPQWHVAACEGMPIVGAHIPAGKLGHKTVHVVAAMIPDMSTSVDSLTHWSTWCIPLAQQTQYRPDKDTKWSAHGTQHDLRSVIDVISQLT